MKYFNPYFYYPYIAYKKTNHPYQLSPPVGNGQLGAPSFKNNEAFIHGQIPFSQNVTQNQQMDKENVSQGKQQHHNQHHNQNHQQNHNHQQNEKQKQKKSNSMISFDKLKVGTVSSSSGIFNGKNIQFGWSSHSKSNTGFGKVSGHNNKVNQNTNVVFDNDHVDTPIDDRDTMWSQIPTT